MRHSFKIAVSFLIVTSLFISHLAAFTVSEAVDKENLAVLKEKGKIDKTFFNKGNVAITLAPDTPLTKKALQKWPTAKGSPVFVAEELYLLNKKTLNSDDTKATIDYASKVIRSISKMEGMQYYSHSDKKIETLYKECYCIKGAKDRIRVPDDVKGNAEGKVLYCYQNDNSFGKTNYRLEYHQDEKEVSACFINTTPIYLGVIKGIDTDDMRINLVITDCGDSMLVYMLVQAKMPAVALFEKTMNDSFGARLDAIYKWFVLQF